MGRDVRPIRFWRYAIRTAPLEGATAILDSTGFFAVSSSYGNWCFHWGGANGDFRDFFSSCYGGYIASKLQPGRFYDGDATYQAVKEAIIETRREGRIDRDRAREMWSDLDELHGSLSTESDFDGWVRSGSDGLGDAWELGSYGQSSEMQGFIENILPSLQAAIRADYAEECAGLKVTP